MKHLKVILYDETTKTIIEHESFSDGELILGTLNDAAIIELFLKVDELTIDDVSYRIVSRRLSLDGFKLVINLKIKE